MGREILSQENVVIDERRRIVLRSELLKEMKLKVRDKISVYGDYEKNKIVIKKQNE